MFTGIIQNQAKITSRMDRGGQVHFIFRFLKAERRKLDAGESIAVNGVCLTVVKSVKQGFEADTVRETLRCTTLSKLKIGDIVNTERALRYGDAMGGHFMTGHVDGVARVAAIQKSGRNLRLTFELPSDLKSFVADKGSIAVDGISLTLQSVKENTFSVAVVPHTRRYTNLGRRKTGDEVNLEADLVARYLKRIQDTLRPSGKPGTKSITIGKLKKFGF